MSRADIQLPQPRALGKTQRTDAWWLQPTAVFLGFAAFIVYSTWAAHQGTYFFVSEGGANYLSPFYSPLLFEVPGQPVTGHSWFGQPPAWLLSLWPSFLPFSPAILILWAPGGFRFTCYYYRGAYYKAFWADPPACSVGEPGFRGKKYRGEATLPLLIQNIHRYLLYFALVFIVVLMWDAIRSYTFHTGADRTSGLKFGVGVGSLILTINPILLAGYTLGCHSLRHLVGGKKDCIGSGAGGNARRSAYDCVSCLNRKHMIWAWLSLFWVAFTDIYVRLVSMGVWTDFRLL